MIDVSKNEIPVQVDLTPITGQTIFYICVDPRFRGAHDRLFKEYGFADYTGSNWYAHTVAGGAADFAADKKSPNYLAATGELAVLLHKHRPNKLVLTVHQACAALAPALQTAGTSEEEFLANLLRRARAVVEELVRAEGLTTSIDLWIVGAHAISRID